MLRTSRSSTRVVRLARNLKFLPTVRAYAGRRTPYFPER